MRITLTILMLALTFYLGFSQEPAKVSIYNPEADARAEIAVALKKATAENKQVLLQVGGNWCKWCVKMHNLYQSDAKIDSILKASYVIVYVNYSKENKNLPLLKELGNPQRFGFPVLVILDKTGVRQHTQDSGLLESGNNGYDVDKVFSFLNNWTVEALNPKEK